MHLMEVAKATSKPQAAQVFRWRPHRLQDHIIATLHQNYGFPNFGKGMDIHRTMLRARPYRERVAQSFMGGDSTPNANVNRSTALVLLRSFGCSSKRDVRHGAASAARIAKLLNIDGRSLYARR
jgi:hypothetical protein